MVRKEIRRLNKTGHVVLCQGINFLGEDEKAPELIAPSTDLDRDISIQELINEIKRRCAKSDRSEKLISMALEDDSRWEILASNLNVSKTYIREIFQRIKTNLNRWRLENKETFSELSFDTPSVEYEIEHKPEMKNNPEHKKGFVLDPGLTRKEIIVNNKNHHPVAKIRPLTETEVKKIRDRFIELDGVIPDDTWVTLKKTMSKKVSIFQITGQVLRLHREVARGTVTLKNKRAYIRCVQAKRRKWMTYKSEKYLKLAERAKKLEIKNNPKRKKGSVSNPLTSIKKEIVVKNKNHHPIAKVRPLNEAEIKKIRDRFIELDGVIPNDTWVDLKKTMSKDISIFQITGQVVRFHREVAKGTITLKNKRAYTMSIKAKRNKWMTYNSKKYKEFAKRTGAQVKKITTAIAKRVKVLKKTKAPKAEVLQKISLRILKKDNTFETREVEATSTVDKTDIPKLLNWKSVPKDVVDYMVVA
jgi:ribosomal protein S13